ncbi:MAG: 5-formyltetrahydrofolate cyclo-ligase [Deltaproteobacteria bacterium]|jgi:5-formyltetrahydrofolate cyclo-ligase|nr:5-formyltetrahydrofolate cyclo-ligase [Deltaproteobacteria bacterium]
MEEVQESKSDIRNRVVAVIESLSAEELAEKTSRIEKRLFEFANFMEANISLLYMPQKYVVDTKKIIQRCFDYRKIVALPAFNTEKHGMLPYKVDAFETDLTLGPRNIMEPDPERCKIIPIDRIDIAIIPGVALDEKGGRIGSGEGYYDRLIGKLPITTRKVALALECQIVQQVPMESHDKFMDIIITEDRIIYKI